MFYIFNLYIPCRWRTCDSWFRNS